MACEGHERRSKQR
jgi:hypothetical protein